MTTNLTLSAIKLLGDMLEEKETELSINGNDHQLVDLNELWKLYEELFS